MANRELTIGERLKRSVATGVTIALGGAGLAACSAEAPKVSASGPAVPGGSETPTTPVEKPSIQTEFDVACSPSPEDLAGQDFKELEASFSINGATPEELAQDAMRSECAYLMAGTTQKEIDSFKTENGTTDVEAYTKSIDSRYYEPFDNAAYAQGVKIGNSARIAHEALLDYAATRSDFGNDPSMPAFKIEGINVTNPEIVEGSVEKGNVTIRFTYEPSTNVDELGNMGEGLMSNKHVAGWLSSRERVMTFVKGPKGFTIKAETLPTGSTLDK